jgi:hypothetical protein
LEIKTMSAFHRIKPIKICECGNEIETGSKCETCKNRIKNARRKK